MMFAIVAIVLLSFAQSGVIAQLTLGSPDRNVKPCELICDDTYGNKDSKNPDMSFCKRGCRLLSIIDFINDAGSLEQSRNNCVQSCRDAYSGLDNSSACSFGCESQLPTAELRRQQMSAFFTDESDIFAPLTRMQQYYNRMMNCFGAQVSQRVVYRRWSVYAAASGEQVIILSSGSDMGANAIDSTDMKINEAGPMAGTLLEGQPPHKSDNDGWLSDLAKRTSLPKQSIFFIVILLCVILAWLCIGVVMSLSKGTEPDPTTQKLSIYGDLDYLYDIDDKAMLAYLRPQEPHKIAPPLPIKIHVQSI